MRTIRGISRGLNNGGKLALLMGDFLDEFYRQEGKERAVMLAEEPAPTHPESWHGPYLAATAHKLANDSGLEPPPWAFGPAFSLPGDRPYIAERATGDLRSYYLLASPGEFKSRNIFISPNCLSRV